MTRLHIEALVIMSAGCSHACICPGPCYVDSTQLYAVFRGDDLDTRLLRAMVIKGILEQITTSTVNLVNADLLAKTRGLRIIESTVPSEGRLAPFQPSPPPHSLPLMAKFLPYCMPDVCPGSCIALC